MIVIRPIELRDQDALERFAFSSTLGITNLPKNSQLLQEKVLLSIESLQRPISKPTNEYYLFVLEDLNTGELGGTSAITSKIGVKDPSYFYRVDTIQLHSSLPDASKDMRILSTFSYTDGPSEICALYLMPHFRREGLGRLLSLSRFLFVASHPNRFENVIMAEMRGIIDKNDISPFWEGLGRKFLDVDFAELMQLQEKGREFISEILPKWPIYVSMLSPSAQDVIGKTHPDTKPALSLLTKEGFQFTTDVDVFDAGPRIEAKRENIRAISASVVAIVDSINHDEIDDGDLQIISNLRRDFRACYAKIKIRGKDSIAISRHTAEALRLKQGEYVRYVSPTPADLSLQSKKVDYEPDKHGPLS
jgi:arginine N-succinyltransferase